MVLADVAKPIRHDGLIIVAIASLALAAGAGFAAPLPLAAAIAASAGAAGLAALHLFLIRRPPGSFGVLLDIAVIGSFTWMRDDGIAIWQIPAHWDDVLRLTPIGFGTVCLLYIFAAVIVETQARRHLSWREALSVFLTPILFNLLLSLGSDGLMSQIGGAVSFGLIRHAASVSLGRILILAGSIDTLVSLLGLIIAGSPPRPIRLHGLLFASSVLAALTPLIADAPQAVMGLGPLLALPLAVAAAALAQAGLWCVTFLVTGVAMDALRGAPPTFIKAYYSHAKNGFLKGAIYGGVFMFLLLAAALILRQAWIIDLVSKQSVIMAAFGGALLFPLAQTLVASADGTLPFFGRLRASYQNPRAYVRGFVVGCGIAIALSYGLSHAGGGERFLALFVIGALAYGGVDFAADLFMLAAGRRKVMETWRPYVLGLGLGGLVAGALGWYFDEPQIAVVGAKFWSYVDVSYAAVGRPINTFAVYPWFSKWGMLDLGSVGGGVRLFFDESLSGVINWAIAAPLFGINFFVLEALFTRSLGPLKKLTSAEGFIGLVEQTVRVLRWGLWMAPVINSFLRQSPDPSWYNQDGAVRTVAASAANIVAPQADFRSWSLSIFTGLLAYDWLRVLIWFDHMGLRVATLVNLTFVGGDRADEATARFIGHSARTRAIPEGIRRFATWTPLLIPFYIPRGAAWDTAWTGAERLRATNPPLPMPIQQLLGVYGAAGVIACIAAIIIGRRWGHRGSTAMLPLSFVPEAVLQERGACELSNGFMRLSVQMDGRGYSSIEGLARGGQAVDVTRRLTDPLQLRGPFFYLSDTADDKTWSLGFEPVQIAGRDYAVTQPMPNLIKLSNRANEIDAQAEVSLADGAPCAIWRLRLTDRAGKARRLKLTSYRELACHEPGSYVRDQDFNAMHVQTWFMQPLNAIFARNRLLHDRATHRMSREIFFHAAIVQNGEAELVGYEDSRTRFIGSGDVRHPDGVGPGAARPVQHDGSLYTFDPAASLTLDVMLAAHGTCEIIFLEGHAGNECDAANIIAKYLGHAPFRADEIAVLLAKPRLTEKRAQKDQSAELWPFAFSHDGTSLALTPQTPRPWAHILANRLSQGVVVSNEGEIHSFAGNERQNALTPFSFESVPVSIPGQLIYAVDLETNEADTAGYVPFRRADARYDVTYEMGAAKFRCIRETVDLELIIFVPPDAQADIRILTLRNPTDRPKRFRVVPYFEMVLDENQPQSRGKLQAERDAETGTLLFSNPANDFRKGWAFAATSLAGAASEMTRTRFVGGKGRDLVNPVMVETGQSDSSRRDDGSRVAAFAGIVEVPAKGAIEIVVVLGQTATRAEACRLAAGLKDVAAAKALLQTTRKAWAQSFAKIQIETNQPAFDRLVNHWLPYQLLTSRLWGRTGPNQRGGAFGYRDQLQDVLPLVFFDPAAVRRQIVLHAAQQFPEGDVFKWWHQAPNGETGIGQRTRASDPHLWLPYVVTRYIKATGDEAVLDEKLPYLEGPKIPDGVVDLVFAARPSREMGSVYDHCRRAINHALGRFGSHGLPLIGTGDWNDSIDVAGLKDKGESVWLGFFLHDVLTGFSDLVRAREGDAVASVFQARTAALQHALDAVWLGDRYPLAYDDSGAAFDVASAMTAAWPVLSGAAGLERGRRALDEALRHLEKDDRILLVTPAFDENSTPFPGRVTDYPPGVRENGGQYSHGVSWVVDAYMRLAAQAKANGEDLLAAKMATRAFECWVKISPIGKTEGDSLATYGLAPHQQPADIYDGPGYEGRGGWSWYTGSAARMLSAAYAILGLEMKDGEIIVPDDLFEPKGALQVKAIRVDGHDAALQQPQIR